MKKTLTILFAFIALGCSAQTNIMQYSNEAAPDNNDYLYLIKDGTSDRNTSKLQFQQNVLDSLAAHWAAIALNDAIIAEIDSSWQSAAADTFFINESQKPNHFITYTTTPSPTVQLISTEGIEIRGSNSDPNRFGSTAQHIKIGPTTMDVVDNGNNKGLEYDDDYSGNFTDRSLIDKEYVDDSILIHRNEIEALYAAIEALQGATLIAHYKFEADTLDETTNSFDYTENGTITYDDRDIGNNVINLSLGDFADIDHTINLTSTFTLLTDIINSTSNEPYRVIAENITGGSGFKWILNPSDSSMIFRTFSSASDSSSLTSPSGVYNRNPVYPYTPFRGGVTGSKTGGSGIMYVNGANVNATGSLETSFTTQASIRLGSATQPLYARLDNFKIYTGVLSSTEISAEWQLSDYFVGNDIIPPTILSATTATDSTFVLTFDEAVTGTSSADFTFTADAVGITIDSINTNSTSMLFFTDAADPYLPGEALLLSYNSENSAIQDLSGNNLASFSNMTVINNIVSYLPAIAYWKWEGNYVDEIGNYNGTAVNSPVFHDAVFKCGVNSLFLEADDDAMNAGNVDFTSEYTIAFWINMENDFRDQYICANSDGTGTDGFYIYVESNGRINVRVHDGGSNSGFAQSNINAIDFSEWDFVVIRISTIDDKTRMWVNNVNETVDSTLMATDWATSGQPFYVGARNTAQFGAVQYLDEFVIIEEWISNEDARNLYAEQCNFSFSSGDDVDPDSTEFTEAADIYLIEDYEGFTPGKYTTAMKHETFGTSSNYEYWRDTNNNYKAVSGISYPEGVDRAYIVAYDTIHDSPGYTANQAFHFTVAQGTGGAASGLDIAPPIGGGNQRTLYHSINIMWRPGSVWDGEEGKLVPGFITQGVTQGGVFIDEGCQFRIMFDGRVEAPDNIIKYYYTLPNSNNLRTSGPAVFDPDQYGTWGDYLDVTRTDSVWHNLTIRMSLGTGTIGWVEFFWDGKLSQSKELVLTGASNWNIGWIRNVFFYGGGGSVAPVDEWYMQDDQCVFDYTDEYKIANSLPLDGAPSQPGRELLLYNWPKE